MTVVGLLDVVKVSNSEEFKPFLLIICMDALESTTNSLSSGLIVDGEGKHHFSVGEKNAVSRFTSNFRIFFCGGHDGLGVREGHEAWEKKRMNQKYASPVACLSKTAKLIRSLRDDERVMSQETRMCK